MERQPTYCVYVKFMTNPLDVRQFRVSDEVSLSAFDRLVREEYGRHYTYLPEDILYYVDKKIAGGRQIKVLASSVINFFYDGAVIVAYGLWDGRDTDFPSWADYETESALLTASDNVG